jgi:hypothetical protein
MSLRQFVLICTLTASFAGQASTAHAAIIPEILPKEFGGWLISGVARTSSDPAAADASNPALLKEYGFSDFASANYTGSDGRKLAIKAARFADATGAYGAFTFYRLPQMLPEQIGDRGASWNERVLFFRGNILVDAVFQKLSAMSAAELRELAGLLPLPGGGSRDIPSLPGYLPAKAQVDNSIKYVLGPIGLAKIGAPLPPDLVAFNAGAEVAEAGYRTTSGDATLMVIYYPTPQIASKNFQRIDAARSQNSQPTASAATKATPYFDKRTGPIVAVAAGPLSQSDAQHLLSEVNYEADVTWNQNTYFTKKDNIANLLVNVIVLCGIIGGFAIVAGIAFGGFRVLLRRLLPERVQKEHEEMEFISLHLSDKNK